MIVARVRRTIEERGLFPRGARVLVACSGGPDSAALLAALAELSPQLGLSLSAASVDHGLREGSAGDVALAGRQAAALGVAFEALQVTVQAGASVQHMAREARYGALRQAAAARGASHVAVGHTLDDQAETVLMRLLRGASVQGLSGVQPRRQDGVVRPLIDCRREAVAAYAQARFAQIAADPSNADGRFLRVRVRNGLLPALQREDPSIETHLAALADDVREMGHLLEGAAAALLAAAADGEGLRIGALLAAPAAAARAALRRWVRERTGHDVGRAVQAQLAGLLRGRGEVWVAEGQVVVVSDGLLRLSGRQARTPPSG